MLAAALFLHVLGVSQPVQLRVPSGLAHTAEWVPGTPTLVLMDAYHGLALLELDSLPASSVTLSACQAASRHTAAMSELPPTRDGAIWQDTLGSSDVQRHSLAHSVLCSRPGLLRQLVLHPGSRQSVRLSCVSAGVRLSRGCLVYRTWRDCLSLWLCDLCVPL